MASSNEHIEFSYVDLTLVSSEINKLDPSKKASGAVPNDKLKVASNA